ncbi:spermatogenesis-associated protein 7-like isoform X2 [Leucoraja erinacea]|uniref:spermatogenesis-associated protein 7-like isoform X2 n=1 Tax=Leucoraja erinaceus TaxID=7782 RepID=UPI0024582609|nr:spermatogenesis-associated protein 7-like isoform X2 [Leucoraja erinacea]
MGRININMANKKAYYVSSPKKMVDQHLTQAHMTSHYNRILSAKASVDCSVPKSMLLSVKYQDQRQKQNLLRQNRKGFISARSECWSSSDSSGRLTSIDHVQNRSILEHNDGTRCLTNGCITPNQTIVSSQEFSILPSSPSFDKETAQKIFTTCYSDLSSGTPTSYQQHYKTFCSSSASLANQHYYRTFQDPRQKTYSGDVLDKHAHHFTNEQRFRPRILKKEAESSLAHYRYYTPVKKKKLSKRNLVTQETQTDFNRLSSTIRIKSPIMRKVQAEEEELKYLEFISDITSEILTRGLFSNRVIESIFERRIEESKHRLDEQKLRSMLDELKKDLDCKPEKEQWTSSCETLLEEPKLVELNNCHYLGNCKFTQNWMEDTDKKSDKALDHRLNGIFSTDVCYLQDITRNKHCHDICGENIKQVQDVEQDHCLDSNCTDHSGHFTDYAADFDSVADLTEIDNLAMSLHSVNVNDTLNPEILKFNLS